MKIHLRANKIREGKPNMARCAAKAVHGCVIKNDREKYHNIPQENIVGINEFARVPESERCAHCVDMGLIARNRIRKQKGLAPVKSLFANPE